VPSGNRGPSLIPQRARRECLGLDLTWGDEGPVNHSDHRAVGLATLDACRDAANEWVFPEAGPPCTGIRDAYVAATGNPTHFVDVTATLEAGIASRREHHAYIDGLVLQSGFVI